MKVALTCLAMLAVAAPGEASDGVRLGGYGLLLATGQSANTDGVNARDVFSVKGARLETALGLEGQIENIGFRGRANRVDGRSGPSYEFELQDLSAIWALSDTWLLTLGKTQLSWDFAKSATPLGFFQREFDPGDPFDTFGRSAGLPLVALTWAGNGVAATLVYSNDKDTREDGFNRGLEQWAIRATADWSGLSASGVLRYVVEDGWGVGASMVWTVSDMIVAHASVYGEQGTRRYSHSLLRQTTPSLAFSNPFVQNRKDDGRMYWRLAAGFDWSIDENLGLTFELTYDDAGLSELEWDRWNSLVDVHRAALDMAIGPAARGLAIANLDWDAAVLNRGGVRRAYAYSRLSWEPIENWPVSALVKASLEESSAFVSLQISREIAKNLMTSANATGFFGEDGSEYASLPVSSTVTLSVKYSF